MMQKINVVIGVIAVFALLGFLFSAGVSDDLSWISLTQKLNSSGDFTNNVSFPDGAYIVTNGTHLIIGVG